MTESATYRLFYRAMAERTQVICTYGGDRREFCPIILGHTDGEEEVLLPVRRREQPGKAAAKNWKRFTLAKIGDAQSTEIR